MLSFMEPEIASNAAARVERHLASCLPDGVPPCHRRIVKARFKGHGRKSVAVAEVEMFDGQPATVEVFTWGPGCFGHRWTDMTGGCAYYEDGHWRREPTT